MMLQGNLVAVAVKKRYVVVWGKVQLKEKHFHDMGNAKLTASVAK